MEKLEKNEFTLRSIITGAVMAALIALGNVYNQIAIQGSFMAEDFTASSAIFFLFWLVLLNLLLRRYCRRLAFSSAEMILVYVMMIVACAIPTMGLVLYLIPTISSATYYATSSNRWAETIIPYLKPWLIVRDENAVAWFYEGLPKGASIPWLAWVRPLLPWGAFLLALYLTMIFLMVILRRQWEQNEILNYPLTKAPLEMINAHANHLFRTPLFWAGFGITALIGSLNGLHFYFESVPVINLANDIPIFRETIRLPFRVSFPIIGFTYFVNIPMSFSLWFFSLLTTVEQGFLNITGFGTTGYLPYAARPILDWQSLGALVALILYSFWLARRQLASVFTAAVHPGANPDDADEIVPYRVAFWGMLLCLVFMVGWLVASGLPILPAVFFLAVALFIYIGITRVVAEGGLAATRAPMIPPVITTSTLGYDRIGQTGMAALGLTFAYVADIRTFVMASVANGLKMIEGVRARRRLLFWAILVSILVTLVTAIWAVLFFGYRHGAINANRWYFISGPVYPWRYLAEVIKDPGSVHNKLYLSFTLLGAGLAIAFQFMRTRLLWFPFHPLGLAFSTIYLTTQLWFSIFIAWLLKSILLKYAGVKIYERSKLFFIGLIVGQFVVNGIWLIIDGFTGKIGNQIFWI